MSTTAEPGGEEPMIYPLGPDRTEGLRPFIVARWLRRVFAVCHACPNKEASDKVRADALNCARQYAVWAMPMQYVDLFMREMEKHATPGGTEQ